jgi:hypothetical protein
MRHWALWGIIPLDWFYLTMLVAGSVLLLVASPLAPWNQVVSTAEEAAQGRPTGLGLLSRLLRSAVALALLFTIISIALSHHARL